MATDVSDVVKQGYVRIRSRKLGLWQRRWIILRRASSKGPCRLEKYVDERSARSGQGHKVALLTSVSSVSRIPSSVRKHAFVICFLDSSTKCMACDSDLDADTWVKLLVQESLVPQPGLSTGEPDVLSPGIQKELQEQFHVYLMPTPKLDVFGECLLQVTHENIYLWDIANPRLKLVAWPLTALRRYGSDPTKFTFEAGRHCATGEGMFVFHTLEGEKIYRKVHQATLAIAEAHHRMKKHGENTSSSLAKEASSSSSCRGSSSRSLSFPMGFQETSSYHAIEELEDSFNQETLSSGPQAISESEVRQEVNDDILVQASNGPKSKCSLRSHLLQYSN